MDYEKKYKEALEVAQRFYNNSAAITKKGLEDIFPELREFDDEMIRKLLVAYFAKFKPDDMWESDFSFGDILAWLERQGEQKSIDDLTQQEAMDIAVAKCFEQGEQKPAESNDIEDVLLVHDETLNNLLERYKTSATFKTLIVNLQNWWNNTRRHLLSFNIEQNSAWSEKDEEMLKLVIKSCEQCGNEYAYYWLKSLKDRIQPQQEWSEEDDKNLKGAIQQMDLLEEYINDGSFVTEVAKQFSLEVCRSVKNWLKSLSPQKQWKPSDEQLNALCWVLDKIKKYPIGGYSISVTHDLLKQLKAL